MEADILFPAMESSRGPVWALALAGMKATRMYGPYRPEKTEDARELEASLRRLSEDRPGAAVITVECRGIPLVKVHKPVTGRTEPNGTEGVL